ncbi:MAG: M23 family metallopeptidase [bacterium]
MIQRFLYFLVVLLASAACQAQWPEEGRKDAGGESPPVRVTPEVPPLVLSPLPTFTAPKTVSVATLNDLFLGGVFENRIFGSTEPRHLGVDFVLAAGSPVQAIASGMILPPPVSGRRCEYGSAVAVWSKFQNGIDFVTIYGHLSNRANFEPSPPRVIYRGETVGYSAFGAEAFGDDESCDENREVLGEYTHIGIRLGAPATNNDGNLVWNYPDRAKNGEDVDIDAESVNHGGKFTEPVEFANCHGTHVGIGPDPSYPPGTYETITRAYCERGGFATLGASIDAGLGNGLTNWNGTWCQQFSRDENSLEDSIALCLNASHDAVFASLYPIWSAYSKPEFGTILGEPQSDTLPTGDAGMNYKQRFKNGTMFTDENGKYAVMNDNTVVIIEETDSTESSSSSSSSTHVSSSTSASAASSSFFAISSSAWIPSKEYPSSSSSSTISYSSSTSRTDENSSHTNQSSSEELEFSSSSTAASSSSSSRAASNSSSGPDPNETDPPYTECGRYGFNQIVNGEFRIPPLDCGWSLENPLQGAHAEQVFDANNEARARIWTTTPLDPWRAQLKQYVQVFAGAHYLFRFRAKADHADRFIVQLMKEDSPWTNYGLWIDTEVPAGIEQEFSVAFTATTSDSFARLAFQFGQTSTGFTIDKIWLEEIVQ